MDRFDWKRYEAQAKEAIRKRNRAEWASRWQNLKDKVMVWWLFFLGRFGLTGIAKNWLIVNYWLSIPRLKKLVKLCVLNSSNSASAEILEQLHTVSPMALQQAVSSLYWRCWRKRSRLSKALEKCFAEKTAELKAVWTEVSKTRHKKLPHPIDIAWLLRSVYRLQFYSGLRKIRKMTSQQRLAVLFYIADEPKTISRLYRAVKKRPRKYKDVLFDLENNFTPRPPRPPQSKIRGVKSY